MPLQHAVMMKKMPADDDASHELSAIFAKFDRISLESFCATSRKVAQADFHRLRQQTLSAI
jgi:hypothetical protein